MNRPRKFKRRKPKPIYAEEKYNTNVQNYRGIKFKYAGIEIPDWMRGKL